MRIVNAHDRSRILVFGELLDGDTFESVEYADEVFLKMEEVADPDDPGMPSACATAHPTASTTTIW